MTNVSSVSERGERGGQVEQPLLRFVQVTDLHVGQVTNEKFGKATERTMCLLTDLVEERVIPRPEFVLVTGDLTSRGAADVAEHEAVRQLLDATLAANGIAWYAVPGNHDLGGNRAIGERFADIEPYEDCPLPETRYGRVFPDGLRVRFSRGPFEFIGLALRNGDPDGQLDWLEAQLASPQGSAQGEVRSAARGAAQRPDHGPAQGLAGKAFTPPRRIVFCHYPVYTVRSAGVLGKWGLDHVGECLPRLRRLLSDPAHGVHAYLHGHLHVLSSLSATAIEPAPDVTPVKLEMAAPAATPAAGAPVAAPPAAEKMPTPAPEVLTSAVAASIASPGAVASGVAAGGSLVRLVQAQELATPGAPRAVYHLGGGGVGAGATGFRYFEVYADRVVVTFHPLSDQRLQDFSFWSGADPSRTVDPAHPNSFTYHAGTAAERRLIIPI